MRPAFAVLEFIAGLYKRRILSPSFVHLVLRLLVDHMEALEQVRAVIHLLRLCDARLWVGHEVVTRECMRIFNLAITKVHRSYTGEEVTPWELDTISTVMCPRVPACHGTKTDRYTCRR